MTIELKKKTLVDVDTRINQKMYALHEKPTEDSSIMKRERK
jgi:hypothetical protein